MSLRDLISGERTMVYSRILTRFASFFLAFTAFALVVMVSHQPSASLDSKPGTSRASGAGQPPAQTAGGLTGSSSKQAPATVTTLVNYNLNSGTSYPALTPALVPGITSTATSTKPFATAAGTVTNVNAFIANP